MRSEQHLGVPEPAIPGVQKAPPQGLPQRLIGLARADSLTRNSVLLVCNYLVVGAIGAICSVLAAREWVPHEVGAVGAITGVVTLLSAASSIGLVTTITRFLGAERQQLRFVLEAICITVVVGVGLTAAVCFVPGHFGAPVRDLTRSVAFAFLLLGGYVAGNNIVAVTDPAFLARNEVSYTVVKDLSASVLRIGILIALIGTGAAGLFGASVIYSGVAAALDVCLVIWRLRNGGRTSASFLSFTLVRRRLRFALASHSAALVAMLPGSLIVTIVAAFHGATAAAYVSIPLAAVLFITIIPSMTSQALLADLARPDVDVVTRAARAMRIAYIGTLPAAAVAFTAAPLLLSIFGHAYSAHSVTFLRWAVAATVFSTFNYIGDVVLLGRQQVLAYNFVNVVGTIAILTCVLVGVTQAQKWVGPAWFEGQFLYAVVSVTTLLRHGSRADARRALKTVCWPG